jgi:hypothetical protein
MDGNEDSQRPGQPEDAPKHGEPRPPVVPADVNRGRAVVPPRADLLAKLQSLPPDSVSPKPIPPRDPNSPKPSPGQVLSGPDQARPVLAARAFARPEWTLFSAFKIDPGSSLGKWQRLKALCLEGLGQHEEATKLFEELGDFTKADQNHEKWHRLPRTIPAPLGPIRPPGRPVPPARRRDDDFEFEPVE